MQVVQSTKLPLRLYGCRITQNKGILACYGDAGYAILDFDTGDLYYTDTIGRTNDHTKFTRNGESYSLEWWFGRIKLLRSDVSLPCASTDSPYELNGVMTLKCMYVEDIGNHTMIICACKRSIFRLIVDWDIVS